MAITIRKLEALQLGQSITDGAARGEGSLVAVRRSGGVHFYFRHTTSDGSRDRLPLGAFDRHGIQGLTLDAAVRLAASHRVAYRTGRDLRAEMAQQERDRAAARAAALKEAEALRSRETATLGALCSAYIEQLGRRSKPSTREIERALQRHVRDRWPEVWVKPAAEVTPEDAMAILEVLTEQGKLREAAKLRTYLRAAYGAAIAAHTNPQAIASLRSLKLHTNPMRDLGSIHTTGNQRERALSAEELRAYWKRIAAMPAPAGPLLRFHLLTGGQRCEQLARATVDSVDNDAETITLLDSKGRRVSPRRHVIPLLPAAVSAINALACPRIGPFVFTANNGLTGARYPAFSRCVREVSAAMVESREATAPFTPGDLRRTVETRLAALGVPVEVRAQLQSHGLGGVQARHYDRHGYADEKRDALERLHRLLTSKPTKVVRSPRKGRR